MDKKIVKGNISIFLIILSIIFHVHADDEDHVYKEGDTVTVWFNKVGPYNNPLETYTYHTLPFCSAPGLDEPARHALGIGEILEGNELVEGGFTLSFPRPTPRKLLCKQTLREEDCRKFKDAIDRHYWYQLNIDDLPLWGLVGKHVQSNDDPDLIAKYEVGAYLLYTHKHFSISHNEQNIIHVNLTYAENVVKIEPDTDIEFTYEVKWLTTDIKYEDRFDRYLEDEFFEHQIHWFSIFNSFMMVIFLCGLVVLILLRTLKNDYAKYTQDDEEMGIDRRLGEDTGWKQVHGDVFRKPIYLSLYCALLGTGTQLLVIMTLMIFIAIVSSMYVEPGGMLSTSISVFALSSIISGYISGSCYYQFFYPNPSPDWIKTMILSVSLLPGVVFGSMFCLNWISVFYGTTYAIPFITMVKVLLLWGFVSFPLSILGTVLGRHWSGKSTFPCRVNKMPRPIPEVVWYLQPSSLILFTGILPFGSIFIEMYFIFTSFWSYKFYYVYGFMLLVFVILVIVSICVTIVTTYFLLNSENHRWHWVAYLGSGSTALYVYIYAIYFYFFKTNMTGFLQTVLYFGYMGLFSFGFFIMCGTLGYAGSSIFVKRIYRNIKSE